MDKLKMQTKFDDRYKHINLMPFQWEPFNGDAFICEEILRLKERHKIDYAIELGTCLGSSTLWLVDHFSGVSSSEINPEFYEIAKQRFSDAEKLMILSGETGIVLYNEDSRSILSHILPSGDSPVLIFIDSHWGPSNPLLQELDIIAQSGNKNVVLVIHDFKVPGHPELGWDEYKEQGIVYEWSWIESRIEKIYGKGKFNHYYNSEATGAKRGVVFIEPKI